MDRVASTGYAEQEREGNKAGMRAEHGGSEVVAGGGSGGRGALTTRQQGGETRPG
jgi:hypothetical protein